MVYPSDLTDSDKAIQFRLTYKDVDLKRPDQSHDSLVALRKLRKVTHLRSF